MSICNKMFYRYIEVVKNLCIEISLLMNMRVTVIELECATFVCTCIKTSGTAAHIFYCQNFTFRISMPISKSVQNLTYK